MSLVPCSVDAVKMELSDTGERAGEALRAAVDVGASVRDVERLAWTFAIEFGRSLMAAGLAGLCARATNADVAARGLRRDEVSLRMDSDGWGGLYTTFGLVPFPWFTYRDRSVPVGSVMRTPARDAVVPYFRSCRSSELLLEWESRLGSDHPFRQAQQALSFFSHGAVRREDTTISRHMVRVATLVDRTWTYRSPEEIAETLRTRATRDPETDRPLLYASTDAHALRTYVDETWDAQWKMANGVRVWCVDQFSGSIIHLGGEYTWGDCEEVQAAFEWLRDTGRMPSGGRFASGLNAQLVLVTDGATWIRERILPLFPSAVALLDAYHLMEHLSGYAAAVFGKGTPKARRFYKRLCAAQYGDRDRRRRLAKKRAGHTKRAQDRASAAPMPAHDAPIAEIRERAPAADRILQVIDGEAFPEHARDAHDKLVAYVESNAARIDYERWRARGYQIGSGAMESLHRTGSQSRLKVAGIRCLPETSRAVFNLRMLRLCGNWDAFWSQPDLAGQIVAAFSEPGRATSEHQPLQEAA